MSKRPLSYSSSVSVGTSDTILVGANPKRTRIRISAGPTNRITLAFGQAAVLDAGIGLEPLTQALELTLEDDGEVIQRDIHAISAVGAQTIGFSETMEA